MASNKWLNPAFDNRILKIGPHTTKGVLKRGYIVCDDPGGGAPGMKGMGVRFLYNPVAVSVSHTIDPNNLTGTATQSATAAGQPGQYVNIGSVSVDLLYDRTYEVWDSSKKNTIAGKFGVYADVLGFYRMTGVVKGKTTASSGPLASGFTPGVSGFDEFPRYPVNPAGRYYLFFGDKVRWYGTLTDLEITYSHWTQNMVPSRCSISVSLMFQTDSKGNKVITKGGKVAKAPSGSGGSTLPGQLFPGSITGPGTGILGPLGGG